MQQPLGLGDGAAEVEVVVVAAALRGEGWRTARVEVVRLGLGF